MYASVAQKMSRASQRTTTRVEDIAYCLIGIHNVHMPLLYGEGVNAFYRLQLEIIKTSSDESIFAWGHMWEAGHSLNGIGKILSWNSVRASRWEPSNVRKFRNYHFPAFEATTIYNDKSKSTNRCQPRRNRRSSVDWTIHLVPQGESLPCSASLLQAGAHRESCRHHSSSRHRREWMGEGHGFVLHFEL